jgi:hypothetical protein
MDESSQLDALFCPVPSPSTRYEDLGLVPCQVQDGKLLNLMDPGAGEMRFP